MRVCVPWEQNGTSAKLVVCVCVCVCVCGVLQGNRQNGTNGKKGYKEATEQTKS